MNSQILHELLKINAFFSSNSLKLSDAKIKRPKVSKSGKSILL